MCFRLPVLNYSHLMLQKSHHPCANPHPLSRIKKCVFSVLSISTPTSTLPNPYSKMQCSPYRYKLQHSISDYVKIYTSKAEVVPCSAMCCLPANSVWFFFAAAGFGRGLALTYTRSARLCWTGLNIVIY